MAIGRLVFGWIRTGKDALAENGAPVVSTRVTVTGKLHWFTAYAYWSGMPQPRMVGPKSTVVGGLVDQLESFDDGNEGPLRSEVHRGPGRDLERTGQQVAPDRREGNFDVGMHAVVRLDHERRLRHSRHARREGDRQIDLRAGL